MKKYNKISLALLLGATLGLASCQNDFDDPGLITPVADIEANISIADFKKLAWNENAIQLGDDNQDGNYIIKGRVISSDATGNIYQSLVIQDGTAAMTMSVRRASLYTEYHLGQELVIDTRGLWLGKYNGLIQLGWLGEPYNGEDQLTFMSFAEFQAHAQLNGLPSTETRYVMPGEAKPVNEMYCQVLDIDNLPTSGEDMYNLQGQLVEFRNVSFDDGGKETFAPYQENANRYLSQAGNSLKITVRNSGYATFYNTVLPKGTGTVRGILSWYGDGTSSTTGVIGGWQLLIRSLDDLDFDTNGSQEDPYSVEEARKEMGQGRAGWVSGYIIGSVKAGVSDLKSVDDIAFGTDAEINNNVVIASTADTRDLLQMMVVNLPQGSALRQDVNIVDNPSVVGRVLNVRGELTEFLGFPGVVGEGAASDFSLDSSTGPDNPVTPPATQGDGSETKPFSVAQVINSADDATGVWVVGYVAGYVKDKSWPGDCVFENKASDTDNYNKSYNIILSDSPVGAANAENSIPVGLGPDVRQQLGLKNNPAIFGKKVMVKGNLQNYFGRRGLKTVSEYKEL